MKANDLTTEHKAQVETSPFYQWYKSRIEAYWTAKGDHEALELLRNGRVEGVRLSSEYDASKAPEGPGRKVIMSAMKGTGKATKR
mmetsp:Transcript_37425/g.91730  ORF Transcript_37425/g.91730 Transcript_37425/m.91730 type:complete len:85 (+) Transcript_37425:914-1168(+)